jgi:hypothetical protein
MEDQSLHALIETAIRLGEAVDEWLDEPPPGVSAADHEDEPPPGVSAADHEANLNAAIQALNAAVQAETFARRDVLRRLAPLAADGGSVVYLLPDGTAVGCTDRADGLVLARPDRVFRLEDTPLEDTLSSTVS